MLKKKASNKKKKSEGGFLSSFLESLASNLVVDTLTALFENVLETFTDTTQKITRNVVKLLGSALFGFLGFLFIVISTILLLNNNGILSYEWSLLIIGLIMIIISLMMKSSLEKE